MDMDHAILIATCVALFILLHVAMNFLYGRRLKKLLAEREGESICQFARSLPYRQLDTGVMRRVYEEVQDWIGDVSGKRMPLRATDHHMDTFQMDPDDWDEIALNVARHCGRSIENFEANPYYGRVDTVGGLVHFLCAQPREAPPAHQS
jgi:hypothetical protein